MKHFASDNEAREFENLVRWERHDREFQMPMIERGPYRLVTCRALMIAKGMAACESGSEAAVNTALIGIRPSGDL